MALLHYVQQFTMPKQLGSNQSQRRKAVVIIHPYFSPDSSGPKYEEYCRQKLMLHIPFCQEELLGDSDSYAAAYAIFLQSGKVPLSLEEDIHQLQQHFQQPPDTEVHAQCKYVHVYV